MTRDEKFIILESLCHYRDKLNLMLTNGSEVLDYGDIQDLRLKVIKLIEKYKKELNEH